MPNSHKPLRVLICGDRNWNDRNGDLIKQFVNSLPARTVVIEGGATGADTWARYYANQRGLEVEHYPANWREYGRAAGPIRNKQMLDDGRPDEVHAFHDAIYTSKGTFNMLRQANKAGIKCWLHTHNGVTEDYHA